MTSHADVVIVGGGIQGAAAAWALARRGTTDVVVCERDTVVAGGTGKSSGVVRCHYGVGSLAAMAWTGLRLFENAHDVLGTDIGFVQTGYVVGVGEADVTALHANLATQQAAGVETGEIVLIAPGADVDKVPVLSDLVSLQYIRSETSGELLVGNSDLSRPEPADPDDYPNRADAPFLEMMGEKIGHRFPGQPDVAVAGTYAGCYDVTADLNPIISRTGIDGLLVAAGFSGHGFKIAPAVGELVADLVLDGRSNDPAVPESDFRLGRFADGQLLTSPLPYVGAGHLR